MPWAHHDSIAPAPAPASSTLNETAFYSRALTTAELNDLGSPLATKWGLTWAAVS